MKPTEPTKPTKRQGEILAFVKKYIKENGMPPTRKEISKAFGFESHAAAQQHLELLQKKGVVKLLSNISRGIVVL